MTLDEMEALWQRAKLRQRHLKNNE
jgi:hypothetical protein